MTIVLAKFMQHSGCLAISVITVGELWTWVSRKSTSERSKNAVSDFTDLMEVMGLDFRILCQFLIESARESQHGKASGGAFADVDIGAGGSWIALDSDFFRHHEPHLASSTTSSTTAPELFFAPRFARLFVSCREVGI